MKTRKIPLRKSVVSNEVINKRDLLRIVKNKEGEVFIDPTGKANGRGAYIKLDNAEALEAKKKKSLTVALIWKLKKAFMTS
ncbi:hypothetical protein HMPREF9954_0443 [Streptococcus infantis SK970]|nr:hypothetical protein HMPREF9954_0443 [Streptococcus infantis SK970]